MKKVWSIMLLGSMLLLAGCNGDKDVKKESKEKVEQSTDSAEDMKVYRDVHSKYDKKMNKELNAAMKLWEQAKEEGEKTLEHPQFKKDVQKVTTSTLTDIDHIRKEIRVPKSKEKEHQLYMGYLNETDQALKKLVKLAKEEDFSLIHDIEVHFSTASEYYKRFQKEVQK
ncbi:hypothetical protein QUF88_03515 [Bacillus sp. DX1.1]|uniref:hypothetical protein n=1 Tax=unclassified Bacillus (in: firmicutes) TaxID=185979 RepID=UPI00256FF755|nr:MULTISPECIES: hypothetical protein [unclassified Bacillus (in: firmicutes)]MDM5152995.1 hypothetical protein [Bacillus sp. DX1.1]WJE81972.1 hypothetical protein QRE67_01045 [Bacillus sp. DX3.1]